MMNAADTPIGRLASSLQPCIADIGARGGVDEDLLSIASACSVYGFEPEPEEALRLQAAPDRRWRSVTVLPYAVGGKNGAARLFLPGSTIGASLLRHNAEMAERFGYDDLHIVRREIDVQTVTLDELVRSRRLPRIDFLKVDIEGAELEVLAAGRSVLDKCSALKLECSFLEQREGQPLIWDVVSFAAKAGFEVVDVRDMHRWRRRPVPAHPYCTDYVMPYSRGQVAQCDVIFLRRAETLDDPRDVMMTVIIAAALGYFDYATGLLRKHPSCLDGVRESHGIDIERELRAWSRAAGRNALRRAIVKQLRGLVPKIRSFAGMLSYAKPARPY